jgi:hypothetical protein
MGALARGFRHTTGEALFRLSHITHAYAGWSLHGG